MTPAAEKLVTAYEAHAPRTPDIVGNLFGKFSSPSEVTTDRSNFHTELEETFSLLKGMFYREFLMSHNVGQSNLTISDYVSLEIINILKGPTVNEFAQFMDISAPNAVYKINRLVEKGCVTKERSEEDKREYHLYPTDRSMVFQDVSSDFISSLAEQIRERFTPSDCDRLEYILSILNKELLK